jgi:hypothetical protein
LFFRLIVAVFLMALIHNVTNSFTLYLFLTGDDQVGQQHDLIFAKILHIEFGWSLLVAVIFNLIATLFLGQLIIFHIMLQQKGMTTFEYIRWKEDRKKESKIVVKIQREPPKNQKEDLLEFKEYK